MSNHIPKDFVFCKSLMETPLDSIFFTHKIKIQLQSRAQGGIQIKICFGTIKDLPIWFFWNNVILVSQNSYGYTMVWSSFSSDFSVFTRADRKLIKIGYKSESKQLGCCKWVWLVQKSYGHGFFTCRPPSFWLRVKKSGSQSFFKLAENQAASSLWVGGHCYTRILYESKLLWEYESSEVWKFVLRT